MFQVTVLDIEIQQIERQILGAERKRDAALRQLNNLAQQKQQAAEVQDFLRDKFTNHCALSVSAAGDRRRCTDRCSMSHGAGRGRRSGHSSWSAS